MPPRYLRRQYPTRLKPCQERTVATCDSGPADKCCGVLPCKLCLEWETYSGIEYGSATLGTATWVGTVGGITFVSYWERNYDTGECEFIVVFNGEEVYRADCYSGASCRNPAGEVSAEVDYETGTLRWSVYEPRELQLIDDPDTGCRDFFCGSCRCSCQCLCVSVREYMDTTLGEICDIAYPCDAPVWYGTVAGYEISLALGRDEYGECIITPTIDGTEMSPVSAGGCASMSATITLSTGVVIAVQCKQCTCADEAGPCRCDGRCDPLEVDTLTSTEVATNECINPLPVQLTVDVSATSNQGGTCFNGSGTVTYKTPITGGVNCWEGTISGSCTDCNGLSRTWSLAVTVCCVNELGNKYGVSMEAGTPAVIPSYDSYVEVAAVSCDPFLLDGCIPGDINAFVVACLSTMPPSQQIFSDVCFQIYEVL